MWILNKNPTVGPLTIGEPECHITSMRCAPYRCPNLLSAGFSRSGRSPQNVPPIVKGGGSEQSQSAMADLYLAVRSDRRGIVKIGRSDNPYRRCDALASSHCFRVQPAVVYPGAGSCESAVHSVLDSKRVEGGPGREWFAVTLQQASNAVHQCLPCDFGSNQAEGPGANSWRAAEFIERLMPVAGPKYATEQADIDALAEKLYGNQWQGVLHIAGLARLRSKVGGANKYFYQMQFPDCPQMNYVAVRVDNSADSPHADPQQAGRRVTELLGLVPVTGPKHATEHAEIDALAEKLYGNDWQAVLHAAGLVRHRRIVGGLNRYFYQMQFPGCPQMTYVAIKEDLTAEE
jgi:hypothetical protein